MGFWDKTFIGDFWSNARMWGSGTRLVSWDIRAERSGGSLKQGVQLKFCDRAFRCVSGTGYLAKVLGQTVQVWQVVQLRTFWGFRQSVQVGLWYRAFTWSFGVDRSGGSLKQAVQLIFWAEFSDVWGEVGHTICVRVLGQCFRWGKNCLIGASVKAFRLNSNSKSWFIKGALSYVVQVAGPRLF